MHRLAFIALLLTGAASSAAVSAGPNIIIVNIDDMGWGDEWHVVLP